jgi:ABC-type branched-subunit amino acid transport system ATPase component
MSFEARVGEVVSLVGRNDMGKTTTVRTLMGIAVTAGRWTVSSRCSRVCASGACNRRARSRVASSKCWPWAARS